LRSISHYLRIGTRHAVLSARECTTLKITSTNTRTKRRDDCSRKFAKHNRAIIFDKMWEGIATERELRDQFTLTGRLNCAPAGTNFLSRDYTADEPEAIREVKSSIFLPFLVSTSPLCFSYSVSSVYTVSTFSLVPNFNNIFFEEFKLSINLYFENASRKILSFHSRQIFILSDVLRSICRDI